MKVICDFHAGLQEFLRVSADGRVLVAGRAASRSAGRHAHRPLVHYDRDRHQLY